MRIRMLIALIALTALLVPLAAIPARAQQTEKKSDIEFMPVGPPPEPPTRSWGLYDTSVMLEIGGQIADVNGNRDVYGSQLNYRDGFRVFSFNLRGKAHDSSALFSDFYVQGGGWGNEPYSWVNYGFRRDKVFDFTGSLRQSQYYWLFPGFARSQHLSRTERRMQDFKLTFLPGTKFRPFLQYKRNSNYGPSFTTADFSRDVFLFFEPVRQTYDDYTIGAEATVQRWLIRGLWGYRHFRNDRFITNPTDGTNPGNFAALPNRATLDVYDRLYPARGKIPYAELTIVGRPHPTLEVAAHIAYLRGKYDFGRVETHEGTTFSSGGSPSVGITEDIVSLGETKRPMTTADGNLTWRPVHNFTLTNNFHYQGYDIAGFDSDTIFTTCTSLLNPSACVPGVAEDFLNQYLRLETYSDRIEGRYDFNRIFGVRGGFNYLHRNFRWVTFEDGTLDDLFAWDFINRSWLLGFDLRPSKRVGFFFDLEQGNNTRVFTRTGPADIARYRLRGKFEPWDGIRINSSWYISDNQNFDLTKPNPDPTGPALIPGRHSARNRGFTVDLQMARWSRGYVDIGYARNDILTITDITLPGFGPLFTRGAVAIYDLNDNYAYIDFGGRIAGKLYGDAGYRVTFDTGTFPLSDPRDPCNVNDLTSCENITGLTAFPTDWGGLNFHQPHANLRYAFNDNVTWKAGWTWYGYNQKGGTFSDYKAHIITTSVVLNF